MRIREWEEIQSHIRTSYVSSDLQAIEYHVPSLSLSSQSTESASLAGVFFSAKTLSERFWCLEVWCKRDGDEWVVWSCSCVVCVLSLFLFLPMWAEFVCAVCGTWMYEQQSNPCLLRLPQHEDVCGFLPKSASSLPLYLPALLFSSSSLCLPISLSLSLSSFYSHLFFTLFKRKHECFSGFCSTFSREEKPLNVCSLTHSNSQNVQRMTHRQT